MSKDTYLLVHKDHCIDLAGVNSGAETATLWLARTLASRGNRVVVAAQLKGGEEVWNGVEFWDLGPSYDVQGIITRARTLGAYHLLAACRALPLLLSKSEPHCLSRFLMAHDPSAGALGIKPGVLNSIADGVVCVSEAQKGLFVSEGGAAEKITVIPNGADSSVFNTNTSAPRDLKRLVFAGALVMDKGIDILIRAFQSVRSAVPDAKLDIYGSSAMWGRNPLFNEREIEAAVPGIKFHGSKPQATVAEAFRTGAACVIASRWFDSFPLTAVEAQACGSPVVAFDVGGVKESFEPGRTGILVKEVSEQALAAALVQLLTKPAEIERMSVAAAELARSKFSWQRVAADIEGLCERAAASRGKNPVRKKLGIVTTWNQQCGLATYARYLFSHLDPKSIVILSEEGRKLPDLTDESFVERCWSRSSNDFSRLKAAISKHEIGVLHINIHSVKFFPQPAFGAFLEWAHGEGIKILVQLHSTFTREEAYAPIVRSADRILVHAEQNRLEVIANGARAEQVLVIPHGVEKLPELSAEDRGALRTSLGMPDAEPVILAFGFVQPHKGMEGVLEAVLHLKRLGKSGCGYIVGSANPDDPQSRDYHKQLQSLCVQHGLTDSVRFVERFISDAEVSRYLQAADLVLMNYRSQHYEASGACSLAVGAGAVVATSGAPPFIPFGDAVWHLTSGYPPALAIELLLSNTELYRTVQQNAAQYAARYAWPEVARMLSGLYRDELNFVPTEIERKAAGNSAKGTAPLRVLMQNRPNTFTQRGGDTIVLERTVEELQKLGVEVTVDVEMQADPSNFDLVHLFNFATPDLTRALGQRAAGAGVPFVVTTLLEDVPSFHNQSLAMAQVLVEYVRRGQSKQLWESCKNFWKTTQPSAHFDNEWLARNASALLTNGSRESATVLRNYPYAKNVVEVPLGHEVGAPGDAELFFETYGVRNFVLCVGRLESRKNQLMLLKALEDSELTVVLVGGGFTYQPDYAEAVQSFKRRGETLVLGRLSPEMLASAYAAARVHAIPSWYELPGLVSLEAASHGCAVVVTDNGTARDYFGDAAHYCNPGDEASIRAAIEAAFDAPVNPDLRTVVERFRWDAIGTNTVTVYERILGRTPRVQKDEGISMAPTYETAAAAAGVAQGFGSYDLAPEVTEFQELLERGELAARSQEFEKAHELLGKAEQLNAQSVRLLKARGAVLLAESKVDDAKRYFDRAWSVDPRDSRVLCGLGICELRKERLIDAYRYFVDALAITPDSQVAILQLIPCAYALNRFDDLEKALRCYLETHADDLEMIYCLAGCLFRTGRHEEATTWAKKILGSKPGDSRAQELVDLAPKALGAKAPAPAVAQPAVKAEAAPVQAVAAPSAPVHAEAAPRSAITQAIERVMVPNAPQVTPPSSGSTAIDLEIGNLEEAKRHKRFDEVTKGVADLLSRPTLTPEQKETLLCLKAETAVIEGDIPGANATYAQVLDANPSSARGISGRAVIAAHENRWDEARSLFERAASYRPNYDLALAGLGLCAWQAGNHDAAWERFSQALKSNPENTRALLGLVQIGYPKQRFSEIAQAIEGYLDLHPADLEWMYSLAGCYFAMNKLDEATEALARITLFKPEHEKALELTAMIQAKRSGSDPAQAVVR